MFRRAEMGRMRALLVLLSVVLLPILEIVGIVLVAGAIGGWWTLALVLGTGVAGARIAGREGRRAFGAMQEALLRGVPPGRESPGSGLVIFGGMLLLAPGFITDVLGLLCVVPFTRGLVRRPLRAYGERRLREAEERTARMGYAPGASGMGSRGSAGAAGPAGAAGFGRRDPGTPQGRVVRGEVVHDDEPPPKSDTED